MGSPNFSPNRVATYPRLAELRVVGAGNSAFTLNSAALVQLPQLKALSLHNASFWPQDVPNIAACAPGLRDLHVSSWLSGQDSAGFLRLKPMLTRKLVREAGRLQHLQCLRLTVCVRPPDAPPQSAASRERRRRNAGLLIVRCRANMKMWNRTWEEARPGADAPQLIMSRSRHCLSTC